METNGTPAWQETEAGRQLQDRLASEKTLRALDHLLERIGTLEEAVERLGALMEQGPGMASMLADWADDSCRRAQNRGVDPEERLKNALHLAERLTAPAMVEKLEQVLTLLDEAPGLAGMLADWADDSYRRASERGVVVEERLKAALQLAEKLTEPAVVEKLHALLQLADQAPGLTAMAVDIFDENYRRALEHGIDPQVLTRQGINITKKLSELLDSDEAEALLESGIFKPQTLEVISLAGESLIESRTEAPPRLGLFGLLRGLGDPDRQRALGFLMKFLKEFGKKL